MADEAFDGFSGYGFSLKDEKGRFAVPVDFRSDLKKSSGGKAICLDAHPEWECASAFGLSRRQEFDDLIEEARLDARESGGKFDRYMLKAQLNAFDTVAFDDSGRFIMPPDLVDAYGFDDAVYFHSLGDHIVLFKPETLYAQGPAFAKMQGRCRRLEREARARAAEKKGGK